MQFVNTHCYVHCGMKWIGIFNEMKPKSKQVWMIYYTELGDFDLVLHRSSVHAQHMCSANISLIQMMWRVDPANW